nr:MULTISPECIES: DNA methyltransferase [unclassified Pseudovibrio]
MKSGEPLFCEFNELKDKFGFFLPLSGYERFQAAQENPVDIRATSRLAKLYDALTKKNPEWASDERRHDMNQFMTRIIFCLFAEDTGIFPDNLFSKAITEYGGKRGETAHDTILSAFKAMTLPEGRRGDLPKWADEFPYVNGGLFAGVSDVPEFSASAFQYLKDAAGLDWKEINPDIFGSMIQSIADPKARAELGMHYTSVPNIMKVIGPLFLDGLDEQIEKAWNKASDLDKVRTRLEGIKVFDPACGSGNFLVVAYRELREREVRIWQRLRELDRSVQIPFWSAISLSNFYGIEITDFAAETAKLALFIAEYQANKRFEEAFGRKQASLPLKHGGNIVNANSLRVNWEDVCPSPKDSEEVFICGNPPFLGTTYQSKIQKEDMRIVFEGYLKSYLALDYVTCWHFKLAHYIRDKKAEGALVSTNSICQGTSVATLWPEILKGKVEISFAYQSFKWRNNASANAAVVCVIIGLGNKKNSPKKLLSGEVASQVNNINPYLLNAPNIVVSKFMKPGFGLPPMDYGNKPTDGGNLILSPSEKDGLVEAYPNASRFIKRFVGSQELIKGTDRYCLWISNDDLDEARTYPPINERIEAVRSTRLASTDKYARETLALRPHQFKTFHATNAGDFLIPRVSSENRPYLPVERVGNDVISSDLNQVIYDGPEWVLSLIASRLHLVWIGTVCGKLESRFRYSNTLGWNTFPVPDFSEADKAALEASAREILLTRAEHHPKTIAQLYDPNKMPDDLREAHRKNDELLEKMYIGRPFKNDSERLEHLFKRYAKRIEELKKEAAK